MLDFLELEETVGKAWHRLVGRAASWPLHPDHAVDLDDLCGPLAVVFRGLGGEAGVQLAAVAPRVSTHRLKLRQKLGLAEERLDQPGRDAATLFLPPRIDLFADRALNRALYLWLAAWFAHVPVATLPETDPLRRDLATLSRARATVAAVLAACPGLAAPYAALKRAVAAARPARPLPKTEGAVERLVLALLAGTDLPASAWDHLVAEAARPGRAPAGYQTFLPVPLWGDAWLREAAAAPGAEEDQPEPGALAASDTRRRFATRRDDDQARRKDPFILNRFEKILALAEMVNVARPADDREDENAEKAADDLDEIPLSNQKGKPASRLKFDLDLAPEAVDRSRLTADCTYPEWDYTRKAYLPDHCRVLAGPAADEGGDGWSPDEETRRLIGRVRRQFEALRPRHQLFRAQASGDELDLDALVRARTDFAAGGSGSDRVWLDRRPETHDLAVTILVDVSLSTDAWSEERRILDVEKEALLVLAQGLAACGDDHAILTFTSRRRDWVRVETVKEFGEAFSAPVIRRIAALKPGYYTRIGAALRHAAAGLAARPARKKLLLVLTDGKPNDIDHYEGRFGIEDTRKAVKEARLAGMAVFGVTVDRQAQSYFPTLFGRGGYAIVNHVARLPAALPAIYRHLTG